MVQHPRGYDVPPAEGEVTVAGSVRGGVPDPYAQLKESIYLGDLQPGEHLVETSLAQTFQVSRTPIRQALTRLEQDGLVVRTASGLVVRNRTPGEVLDIYEVRILLEAQAGRSAAERRTNNDVIALRQAHRRYVNATELDARGRVAANRNFHQVLWHATHQLALIDLLQRVEVQLGRFPLTTLSYEGRWEDTVQQHAELVEAIEARDGDRAAEVAHRHFSEARDIRLKLWETEE
jgi:DNA-binding GntR family transcriptional regulator